MLQALSAVAAESMEETFMSEIMRSASLKALFLPGISMLGKARTRALFAMALLVTSGIGVVHGDSLDPCDPLTYGAVGDGLTDNTVAIQTAIDTCAANGGGIVPFNSGIFLTGPFTLKSYITLQVNAGGTILGTTDQSRYVPAYIGTPYRPNQALVSAADATGVAIIGSGTIDG